MNRLCAGLLVIVGLSLSGLAHAVRCDANTISQTHDVVGVDFVTLEKSGSVQTVKEDAATKLIKKICAGRFCTKGERSAIKRLMYPVYTKANPATNTACVVMGVLLEDLSKEVDKKLRQTIALRQKITSNAVEAFKSRKFEKPIYRIEVVWDKRKNGSCPANEVASPIKSAISDAMAQVGLRTAPPNNTKQKALKVWVNSSDGRDITVKWRGIPLASRHKIKHAFPDHDAILKEQKCILPGTPMLIAGSGVVAAGAATIISTYSMAKSQNQIDPKDWTQLSTINTTGWIIAGGGAVLAGIGLSKRFTSTSSFAITPRWNARIGPTGLVIWTPL